MKTPKKAGRKPLADAVHRIQVVVPDSVYAKIQMHLIEKSKQQGHMLTMSALIRGVLLEWIEKVTDGK